MNDSNVTLKDVNISVIGHVDHGKTTFCSALSKAANKYYTEFNPKHYSIDRIDKAPEEKTRGVTIQATHLPIDFKDRRVTIVDCPGHRDYIKNMITGTKNTQFGILLVAGTEGVCPQTKQHVALATALNVNKLFVIYNKMDFQEARELIEFVEMEVDELLKECGAEKLGSIYFSGTKALEGDEEELNKLKGLLEFLESFNWANPKLNEPFRMSIDQICSPKGQGVIVTGFVSAGSIKKGTEVDIIGMNAKKVEGIALSFQHFHKDFPEASLGMDIGMQIRGITKSNVRQGMTIVPRSINARPSTEFWAMIAINDEEEFGRRTPFNVGFQPQCTIGPIQGAITCEIMEFKGAEYAKAGDNLEMRIKLFKNAYLLVSDEILLKEGNNIIGSGRIIEILN